MGRELTPNRIAPFTSVPCDTVVLCGISTCFQVLSPCLGQIAHALLTRPPLKHLGASSLMSPLDLHVLSTPPAFVLSQDQTLMFNPYPHLLLPVSDSPKPSTFSSKSGVYSLRNLTVLSLDLLRCIVFKDRFAFVLSLNA